MTTIEALVVAAKQHVQAEMSQHRTIAAADVRANDLIYNSGRSLSPWIRVVAVHLEANDQVCIETTDWTTYKHCREGIAVKRSEW